MATCDTNALFANAKCFACLSPGEWAILELQLLCEIFTAGGGGGGGSGGQQIYTFAGNPNGNVTPTVTTPVLCVDTTNNLIWQKVDGALTNTGWF